MLSFPKALTPAEFEARKLRSEIAKHNALIDAKRRLDLVGRLRPHPSPKVSKKRGWRPGAAPGVGL